MRTQSVLLLFFVLLSIMTNGSSQSITTIDKVPIVTTTSSSIAPNQTQEGQPEDDNIVPCTPGITGYGLPNITSKVVVGTPVNVSWDYTVTVTNPPSYIDVYIQMFAPGIVEKWSIQVAKKIPSEPRWFMWTPEGLVDGKYKLRFVPDGKETFNVPANNLPCFANGESVPFVTASFSVSNAKGDLGVYNDPYAPNASSRVTVSLNPIVALVSLGVLVGLCLW